MQRIEELSERFAEWVLDTRWLVPAVLLPVLLLGAWGVAGLSVSESMQSYVDETDDEVRFFREQQRIFGDFETILILVEGPDIAAADVRRVATALHDRAVRHQGVIQVLGSDEGPLRGFSDRGIFDPGIDREGVVSHWMIVALDRAETGIQERIGIARDLRAESRHFDGAGVDIHVAGLPVIALDALEQTRADFFAFLWLMPIALGLVLLAFYRLRACVLVPPIVIAAAVVISIGLFSGTGNEFDMISIAFPVVIAVIVFADLIHILHRHHVELRESRSESLAGYRDTRAQRRKLVIATMRPMNIACFMTSLTTAAGFFALSVSPIEAVNAFAVWTAVSIMLAWLVVVLLTPRLLVLLPLPDDRELGRYFNNGMLRGLKTIPRIAGHWSVPPVFVLLVIAAIAGMRGIEVESDMRSFLPDDLPSMVAAERLEGSLLGGDRVSVVIEAANGAFDQILQIRRIDRLQTDLRNAFLDVDGTFSVADVLRGLDARGELPQTDTELQEMLFRLEFAVDERWLDGLLSEDRRHALLEIRLPPQGRVQTSHLLDEIDDWMALHGPTDWNMRTTGTLKLYAMHEGGLVTTMLQSLLVTVGLIAVILLIYLRNTLMTAIAIVANVLPVVLTLGVMGALGIGLNSTTMMMASIVVALAVDNTIHILAAYRGRLARGESVLSAIDSAVHVSGQAVIVSSMALIAGFMVLGFAGLAPMRDFGLMMCVAALAALAVDLLLLLNLVERAERILGRDTAIAGGGKVP